MEQRIGSNSQPQPLEGAGFDPAFIPGLTAPAPGASGRKADAKDVKGEEEPKDEKAAPEAEADTAGEPATESKAATSLEKPAASKAAEASAAAEVSSASGTSGSFGAEPVTDGPVFEASDRRAGIVADHEGVRLRLDDQACEFRWDEIGAVETETGRFDKRYTVTVHTTEGRWYPIEIEATSRSRFAVWDAELDAVLDAYFDDGAAGPEESDADSSDRPEPDAETDTDTDTDADADKSKPDADPVV
ncbi:hypothetical protein ACWZEH_22235 [Streptomyces sp. QTS137]